MSEMSSGVWNNVRQSSRHFLNAVVDVDVLEVCCGRLRKRSSKVLPFSFRLNFVPPDVSEARW